MSTLLRQFLLHALICAVLGALLSIIIAIFVWLFVGDVPLNDRDPAAVPRWLQSPAEDMAKGPLPVKGLESEAYGNFALDQRSFSWYLTEEYDSIVVTWGRYGVPLRTLEGAIISGPDGEERYIRSLPIAEGSVLNRVVPDIHIPIGLVWPGLILNTVVYGSALWLVTGGMRRLRRSSGE